jgi:hypothetical protein
MKKSKMRSFTSLRSVQDDSGAGGIENYEFLITNWFKKDGWIHAY